MDTKVDTTTSTAKQVQDQYFLITDQIPGELWYWSALISILASATFFILGKRDWSIFIGQWSPTFLLLGLFHKLLSPSK